MFILKILSILLSLSALESAVVPETHRDYPFIQEEFKRLDAFASVLVSSFNTDVDPCENYVGYIATGNRTKITELLDTKFSSIGIYTLYDQFLANATDLTDAEKKVKIFFESCINIKNNEFEESIKNLDIRNSVGNFPVLDEEWTTEQFSWADMEAKFGLAGSGVFLDSYPFVEDGLLLVNVKLANRYLFPSFKNDDKYEKIFKPFGLDDDAIATIKTNLSDLEKQFNNDLNTDEFMVVTVEYLKEQVTEFDWEDYLKKIIGKDIENLGKIYLYIDNIDTLKEHFKIGSSNKKLLANFYFMRLIGEMHMEYDLVNSLKPKICHQRVIEYFPDVFANIILKHRVDEHDAENALLVIERLLDLIDYEDVKKAISTKWNEFKDYQLIISTKDSFNKKIGNSYKDLELTTDDYLQNVLNSLHVNTTRHQKSPLSYSQSMNIIETAYFLHEKPRLVYILKFGFDLFEHLKNKFDYTKEFESESEFCKVVLKQKMELTGVLELVESLSLTNNNKYLNEVETLKKYNLTQTKFIFALFTMIINVTTKEFNENEQKLLSGILFTFEELTDEYECEVDFVVDKGQSCEF